MIHENIIQFLKKDWSYTAAIKKVFFLTLKNGTFNWGIN